MKVNKFIQYTLLAFPIVVFYTFVYHYAINSGWNDDWHGIEAFLASWMQQETFADKMRLLFSQMCEHRILYVRLSTLITYQIFGEANYQILMLLGVAHLLILPFVFARVLKSAQLPLMALFPILFFVFNIQPIENIFWAITSLQPNVVIIFGLWAFVLLLFTQNNVYFYLAALLCFIAMFTNGNGMFSFLAALPIVFYARKRSEKMQWIAIIALSFFLYFFDFTKPGIRPDVGQNFTKFPHIIIGDFFAFFGSPIDTTVQFFNTHLKIGIAILSGVMMIVWLSICLFSFLYFRFYTKNEPNKNNRFYQLYQKLMAYPEFNIYLLSCFLFVGLSGAAFATSRASQGIEEAFNSRYKTVSFILFIVFYLSFYNIIPRNNWSKYLKYSSITALFFGIFSYYASLDDVINYRKFKSTDMVNWLENGRYFYYAQGEKSRYPDDHVPICTYQKMPIPPLNYAGFVPGVMKYVNDILFISRKHYHNYKPSAELLALQKLLFTDTKTVTHNEQIELKEEAIIVKVKIKNAEMPLNNIHNGYYAVAVNDSVKLAFALNTQANKFTDFTRSGIYFKNEIDQFIPKPNMPAGKFELRIVKLLNDKIEILQKQNIIVQ